MVEEKSNWDIVECPDCKSKELTIAAVDGDILTFECKKCKKEFERKS